MSIQDFAAEVGHSKLEVPEWVAAQPLPAFQEILGFFRGQLEQRLRNPVDGEPALPSISLKGWRVDFFGIQIQLPKLDFLFDFSSCRSLVEIERKMSATLFGDCGFRWELLLAETPSFEEISFRLIIDNPPAGIPAELRLPLRDICGGSNGLFYSQLKKFFETGEMDSFFRASLFRRGFWGAPPS